MNGGDSIEIRRLYENWDASLEIYSRDWPSEYRCPRPCSLCCERSPAIPVSPAEARVAAHAVERLDPGRRAEIVARIDEIVEQMDGPHSEDDDYESSTSIGSATGLAGACPLLQNGLCSIYEARPLICRAYGFAADQEHFFMGCEILGEILRSHGTIVVPAWEPAFRTISTATVLDIHGKELPPQATLAEMLRRLLP